jgi:EmrB/QacA subfamily drug resistance transporter
MPEPSEVMRQDAAADAPGGAVLNPLRDPVLRRLAIVVILGSVMSVLDTTIVNVAIETLSRDFHTSVSTIQWVTTGYLLALAIVIPMSGWTVERFGAKRMWMISLAMFTVGSTMCGLSWSTGSLIAFRIFQGFGGGMIMPIGQTVMARAAGPQRMGRVMSILGVPTLIAPVLGPVLGGLIVDSVTWRWIFFVNVPIGAVAAVLSLRFLDGDDRQDAGRFDFTGVALLSPGLAGLVYGLSEAGTGSGFGSPAVVVSMVAGAALIAAFVVRSLRVDRPLLDMRLFRDRSFAAANAVMFIFGGALYAAMILLPLYYQVVRGDSALDAGLLMAPQGIAAMISMPLGGRLTDKIGAGFVVPIGMLVFTVTTIAYTQVGARTGYAGLAFWLFLRGLGMGWAMMPIMAAAYANLTRSLVPRATTVINITMRVGGAFGTALVAVVLQRQVTARLPSLSGILSSAPPAGARAVPLGIARPLSAAFGYSFWVVVAVTAVGFFGSLAIPRLRRSATKGVEAPVDGLAGDLEPMPVLE